MKSLIRKTESTRYPGLSVEKYSKRVFWDALWNEDPALLESRGVVKDREGNVVIRPFTKIFNRGENGTDIDRDERCIAVEKINGFMAGITYIPSYMKIIVSTTGSLDSDFVALAENRLCGGNDHQTRLLNKVEQYILDDYTAMGEPTTWLFEIVDSTDPHIIPQAPGAYLIGARRVSDETPYFSGYWKEIGLDVAAEKMGVLRPSWCEARFSDVVKMAKSCRHEGYVVYGQDSKTSLKIKSPYYLALKAAARIKDIETLDKKRVDEEFYPLIDWLKSRAIDFNQMAEQDRLYLIRQFMLTNGYE